MKNNTFGIKDLRSLVLSFYTNGSVSEKQLGSHILNRLNPKRADVAKRVVDLLMNTSYLKDATKIYISNDYISSRDVLDIMKELGIAGDLTEKTVSKKMYNDCIKIRRDLEDDFMERLIYRLDFDYDKCMGDICEAYTKLHGKDKLRKGLVCEVRSERVCKNLSDEDFNALIEVLKPYARLEMERSMSSLLNEQCGYFHYILDNADKLDEVDLKRYNILKTVLIGSTGKGYSGQ